MSLPLYPGAEPCVGSGFCCKKGPCQFGESISTENPRSSMTTEEPFWSNSDQLMILMALLASITAFATSGDVLHLAVGDALAICARHGLPPERVAPVLQQFLAESKKLRQHNPFAF
jgi:hypothetical protein